MMNGEEMNRFIKEIETWFPGVTNNVIGMWIVGELRFGE